MRGDTGCTGDGEAEKTTAQEEEDIVLTASTTSRVFRGGDLARRTLDEELPDRDDIDLGGDISAAVARVMAAAVIDEMQNVPKLLDFIAVADERLFDVSTVKEMKLDWLFDRRQAAMQTVKDIKAWVLKLLQILQPYLYAVKDDDSRRLLSLLKMMDQHTIKQIIAMCERQLRG